MVGLFIALTIAFTTGALLKATREDWDSTGVILSVVFFFLGGIFVMGDLSSEANTLFVATVGQLSALVFLLVAFVPARSYLLRCTLGNVFLGLGGGLVALFASNLWLTLIEQVGIEHEQQTLLAILNDSSALWITLFAVLVAPVVEEFVFRGGLFDWINGLRGHQTAIYCTAILFGCVHLDSITSVPPLIFFGVILAWLRLYTKSLIVPIIAHITNNGIVMLGALSAV